MEPVQNVVLVVADTFRRDHLGCYAAGGGPGPHAPPRPPGGAGGRLRAPYAAGFPTMPTRADHALGKWTFTFMGWEPLPRDQTTLSQLLAEAGVRTLGVVDTPFYVQNGYGYDRGFQHFLELPTQPGRRQRTLAPSSAPRSTTTAPRGPSGRPSGRWSASTSDRFFLLVDTWDPHEPWDPPAWYVRPYKPDWDGRVVPPPYGYYQQAGLTDDDLATARACYAECTMVDRWIGRLLERLESLGVAEQTALLFTTDHGFHFGEHGGLFGKMVRHDTWVRGRPAWARSRSTRTSPTSRCSPTCLAGTPRRVARLTSAIDLMPSVLELLGVPRPERTGPPRPAPSCPPWRGDAGPGRELAVTTMPLANPGEDVRVVDSVLRQVTAFQPATLSTREWSLLCAARGEPVELYHLPSDPRQATNVAERHPGVVQDLHRAYAALLEATGTADAYLAPRRAL